MICTDSLKLIKRLKLIELNYPLYVTLNLFLYDIIDSFLYFYLCSLTPSLNKNRWVMAAMDNILPMNLTFMKTYRLIEPWVTINKQFGINVISSISILVISENISAFLIHALICFNHLKS